MGKRNKRKRSKKFAAGDSKDRPLGERLEPDFEATCEVCGSGPVVPGTGLCGPCCYGSAKALDWWLE